MPSNSNTSPTTPARTPGRTDPRRLRTALAAAATGVALAVTGLTAGSATATTTSASAPQATAAVTNGQVADWGAGYLARQLDANDGFLAPFGAPDVSNTAYAVLALHAAGVGSKASGEAITWLKSQVAAGLVDGDGNDDAGRLSYTILAALSAGQNPRAFGGSAAKNNLVARLRATTRTSGSDRGLFGSASPTFDGAFRQGLALAALAGSGVAKSSVQPNIAWLTRQQCANGLWTAYRANTATACPAPDPVAFTGPDTNSSALAAQGLAAYGNQPRKSLFINAFHRIQSSDGGFPFAAAPGQSSDPNSTAVSIQGLVAYGAAPTLPSFRPRGHTPYAALASYQLGCSDKAADRGAFFYPGDRSPNILATVQAVPAMVHQTLPLHPSTVSSSVPRQPCTTTSTTSTTATSAAFATAAAAPKVAGTAGACKSTTVGVTVAVDFTAFPGGKVQVRCAPGKPATGIAALQQAGFTPAGTATYGLAFVCRINNLPTTAQQPCVTTPPTNAYWAYYHAAKGATKWAYSTSGASTYKPAQGSIEAWAFGNTAKPSKTPAQVRATKG